MFLCILALLNGYFRWVTMQPYSVNSSSVSSTLMMPGYLGMFLTIVFSPVPDYLVVPVCGFLCSIGLFNPYFAFLALLVGAVVPIEFVCGRVAARPVLLKAMSILHVSAEKLMAADRWIVDHGKFSIFISTFIPFFYSVISLAAGTLKMSTVRFLGFSTVGFALRFVFLESVGYFSIYIFTASFDYAQRTTFLMLLMLSSAYALFHLVRILRDPKPNHKKLPKLHRKPIG